MQFWALQIISDGKSAKLKATFKATANMFGHFDFVIKSGDLGA